jgi:hypothetical protein
MNAYLIGAGKIMFLVEYIAGCPRYEEELAINIYYAETRGKARAMFVNDYRPYFNFGDSMRIVLLVKNVDHIAGEAEDNDPLWEEPTDKVIEKYGYYQRKD